MVTLLGLDVAGKRVVVAGGGPVGARRALALAADGGKVELVAPRVTPELEAAAASGDVTIHRRDVARDDVHGAWLVVAATDDAEVNALVATWADEAKAWCINASDAAQGTARVPAVSRHGDLAVATVSLDTPDPRRIATVRDALARTIDSGIVDLRRQRPHEGRVILVGSGPGAPDLMTIRAGAILAEADVVVADRLGAREALESLADDVEIIEVGKAPGAHSASQEEINALLVKHAKLGKTVVRFKGGDPFLFGRGGEELAACIAESIHCEVVPGVTSALSVPALAGIPVTHRGTSRAVIVTTGDKGLDPVAAAAIAGGATAVILMGVARLAEIVDTALAAGAHQSLPVAIIERGSTPDERITRTSLAQAVADAESVGIASPAVIVIGAVADPGLLAP